MYEHRRAPVLTTRQFTRRMLGHAGLVVLLAAVSLIVGMVGYVWFAKLTWVDAFLNAAMLLGGMGEVNELHGDAAKIFAGGYALYAGVVFIASLSVLLAPIIHRLLHKMHQDDR